MQHVCQITFCQQIGKNKKHNQDALFNGETVFQFKLKTAEKRLENRPLFLPERLFIFGIPALPKAYLEIFQAISQYCDVHLFFNNPCQEYWGDIVDPTFVEKLALRTRTDYFNQTNKPLLSAEQIAQAEHQWEVTYAQEKLQVGNPLLASWGKLGRDFSYLLTQLEPNEISAYAEIEPRNLLSQIQHQILHRRKRILHQLQCLRLMVCSRHQQ